MTPRFEQYARIVAVALLAFGCFLVLEPFLGAILFAGVLCLSTWPVFIRLRNRVGDRSWLAAAIAVLVLTLALAVPVALAAQSIVVHSPDMAECVRGLLDRKARFERLEFVRNIPRVGPWLDSYVRKLLESGANAIRSAPLSR